MFPSFNPSFGPIRWGLYIGDIIAFARCIQGKSDKYFYDMFYFFLSPVHQTEPNCFGLASINNTLGSCCKNSFIVYSSFSVLWLGCFPETSILSSRMTCLGLSDQEYLFIYFRSIVYFKKQKESS